MYAVWNSAYSKAPDQQGKVKSNLNAMPEKYAQKYVLAQVEAAVHFTKTSLKAMA